MGRQIASCTYEVNLVTRFATVFSVTLLALILLNCGAAEAQTFIVLHDFTGQADGGRPTAGVTLGTGGHLYGTASLGGYFGTGHSCSQEGCGMAYEVNRSGSGWTLSPLYDFHGDDGVQPGSKLVFGPDGALYGTTYYGGSGNPPQGTVYRIQPPATICHAVLCPWTESVIWNFAGAPDGANPWGGDLTFDASGNLYGTTTTGGAYQVYGTVFKLSRSFGGAWNEDILFSFGAGNGGWNPRAGIIFDNAGNIYATETQASGSRCGAVSQLVPSESGFTEHVLHPFTCRSYSDPEAGLIMDHAGNLYGAVSSSGNTEGGGAVFELTASSGYFDFVLLYTFDGNKGPVAHLTMDAAGNLYGTTERDGLYNAGSVFKLSPSNGGWTYTSLHDFTGGSDGAYPESEVTIDVNGNLYGTASGGGTGAFCAFGCGVVWEITP